mgnify:CR=1 FL=1
MVKKTCISYFLLFLILCFGGSHVFSHTTKSVELYILPTCPFCVKVVDYMQSNDIAVPIKSTENPEVRALLKSIGGKTQVPCLVFDGSEALYESDDIIDWMEEHLKH